MGINKSKIGMRRQTKELRVDEWEGSIYIKRLTMFEIEKVLKYSTKNSEENIKDIITTIILAVVDEDNKEIFTPSDFDSLMNEPFDILSYIYAEIINYNNIDITAKKKN